MIRLAPCAAAAVLAAAAAQAADPRANPQPADFAWSAPIALEGREALYAAELGLAVYAGAARPDLGDTRVFNGAGEVVPHALRGVEPPRLDKRPLVDLPIFPLWAKPGADVGALSVRIEQRASGAIIGVQGADKSAARPRLAGYLLDASALADRLQALHCEWQEVAGGFSGRVRVDASDDLARWSPVVADAPLIELRHAGHVLAQRRISLGRVKAKYLRISWPQSQTGPQLTRVQAEFLDTPTETPRAWHTVGAVPGERPGEYLFDLGARAPVDRLRLELPTPNTVAPVQFLARTKPDDPWRMVAAATVYQLSQAGERLTSPDTAIAPTAERYWLVRADLRSGGLGAGVPQLTAGFLPHRIVFVARGEGPFTLAFGAPNLPSAALPVATLVPGARDDKPLQAARATIGEARARAVRQSAWPRWLDLGDAEWKSIALWAALFAGVAMLGWMAWRLGRQMGPGDRS